MLATLALPEWGPSQAESKTLCYPPWTEGGLRKIQLAQLPRQSMVFDHSDPASHCGPTRHVTSLVVTLLVFLAAAVTLVPATARTAAPSTAALAVSMRLNSMIPVSRPTGSTGPCEDR